MNLIERGQAYLNYSKNKDNSMILLLLQSGVKYDDLFAYLKSRKQNILSEEHLKSLKPDIELLELLSQYKHQLKYLKYKNKYLKIKTNLTGGAVVAINLEQQ